MSPDPAFTFVEGSCCLTLDFVFSLSPVCCYQWAAYINFCIVLKVMLKAKMVQILFLQIHQNYVKYTLETFTVDRIAIAYKIKNIA